MSFLPYALARPFLFGLDPETAHGLALAGLKAGIGVLYGGVAPDPILATRLWGLSFATPIGIAAGSDKHEVTLGALRAGLISVLVTDEATALFALEHAHDL